MNAPAPVLDTTIALDVSAKKPQKAAKLALTVACGAEPCTFVVDGKLTLKKPPDGRAVKATRFRLRTARNVVLAADATQTIPMKLKRKGALPELVAFLRNGGKATAKLTVNASDGAGNHVTQNIAVRLKP